jgi:UDP:flavonoid glycosyltransferase YjiC (YdhE family)
LELIRRSTLTISHGGLNTALESLAQGVPMVVLPVTYDQPGVGTRVEWAGVGRSIPVGRVTGSRLRDAVRAVLGDPANRVSRVVRIGVYIAATLEFTEHPKVADAASELLRDVFGEEKISSRLVIGVASLPLGSPVELEVILEVQP